MHRTLYIGVTNNLLGRVHEHKNGLSPGFASKYGLDRLVYCESTDDVRSAIAREKQLKGWVRRRKIALIETLNPSWDDLAAEWYDVQDADPERTEGPAKE
jgi:putative endonuclease